jgi:hypothetical protein
MKCLIQISQRSVQLLSKYAMDIRKMIDLLEAAQSEPEPASVDVEPEVRSASQKVAQKARSPVATPPQPLPVIPLLVLTHPGSACGSADSLLGRYDARSSRDGLSHELERWDGHILVVDGELSDEISMYMTYNRALEHALHRAKGAGLISARVFACDNLTPNWPTKVAKAVKAMRLPTDNPIVVSGAWFVPNEQYGCVNATDRALGRAGYTNIRISDYVVVDPMGGSEDDEDD